jgi:hypothetical protein
MPFSAFNALDPTYRGILKSTKSNWALCLGAGICKGILLDWHQLTIEVLKGSIPDTDTEEITSAIKDSTWGLDAWLQVALNEYLTSKKTKKDLVEAIRDEMYRPLLERARAAGMESSLKVALRRTKRLPPEEALRLLSFIKTNYENTSIYKIASWLTHLEGGPSAPKAILTFNADCLLDTFVTLILLEKQKAKPQSKDYLAYPSDIYSRVVRLTDRPKATPIYHLHGCLGIEPPSKPDEPREASNKLVFPESGYSQVSASVSPWQQTMFLAHAQTCRLLFVGLSMSDPNLRRWLSWCTLNAIEEISSLKDSPLPTSGEHIWITKRPDPSTCRFFENSLTHLGVRIGWIDEWKDLPAALDNMIHETS